MNDFKKPNNYKSINTSTFCNIKKQRSFYEILKNYLAKYI